MYKHLSEDQRVEIYKYISHNISYRKIAKIIWVSHTTISREINRNSVDKWRDKYLYKPKIAQKKYLQRRYAANHSHIVLWKDHQMRRKIDELFKQKANQRWPDEILGRLSSEGYRRINTSTLYRFIRNYEPTRQRYLRYKQKWYETHGKRNKRKQMYTDVPNISQRPIHINQRIEIGNREADTIVSNQKARWWAVTLVERKTWFLLISKIKNHHADHVQHMIITMTADHTINSMTFDNGTEFSKIGDLPYQCYRADPYSSWQRWQNERTNWMIRRFIPKWSDINQWTDTEIKEIQDKLNHKPRKKLGYRSPYELYYNKKLTYIS